ncbi:MAG: cytochrome c3 family protein [bacterium]|jgi:hypothetical protein
MKRQLLTLLVLPLFFLLFCSVNTEARIEILSVSSRQANASPDDLFDQPSNGLFVVPLGQKVYIGGAVGSSTDTVTDLSWSISTQPADSNPSLFSNDGEIVIFIPDREGDYVISVQGTSQVTGGLVQEEQRIIAASYGGVGGIDGTLPEFPNCALCHSEKVEEWGTTGHSNIFQRFLNGQVTPDDEDDWRRRLSEHLGRPVENTPVFDYDETCMECHTTGFSLHNTISNGGFDDEAASLGISLATVADQVNQANLANHDNNPENNVSFYNELPFQLKAKANVQCEMCHGPGSQHFGNPQRIAKDWQADSCHQCHDALGYNGQPYQDYFHSSHPVLPATFQQSPERLNSTCGKCHGAQGFAVLNAEGGSVADLDTSVEAHGITCVACHDPHPSRHPRQLRMYGDMPLDSGHIYDNAQEDGLCVACHQGRISPDLENYVQNSFRGPHYSTQADMMLGVNAWDFGMGFVSGESIHKTMVHNSCVTCHMADVPDHGWSRQTGTLVGGHSFNIQHDMGTEGTSDDVNNIQNACLPCHLNMTSLDRAMVTLRDYDGDGRQEGVQSEVQGLLSVIATILNTQNPNIITDEEGHIDLSQDVYNQLSFTQKAAIHNYKLVLYDGSFGIHNTAYSIEVLQKTYHALQGEPLNVAYPTAYMIDRLTNTGINDWAKH